MRGEGGSHSHTVVRMLKTLSVPSLDSYLLSTYCVPGLLQVHGIIKQAKPLFSRSSHPSGGDRP